MLYVLLANTYDTCSCPGALNIWTLNREESQHYAGTGSLGGDSVLGEGVVGTGDVETNWCDAEASSPSTLTFSEDVPSLRGFLFFLSFPSLNLKDQLTCGILKTKEVIL